MRLEGAHVPRCLNFLWIPPVFQGQIESQKNTNIVCWLDFSQFITMKQQPVYPACPLCLCCACLPFLHSQLQGQMDIIYRVESKRIDGWEFRNSILSLERNQSGTIDFVSFLFPDLESGGTLECLLFWENPSKRILWLGFICKLRSLT